MPQFLPQSRKGKVILGIIVFLVIFIALFVHPLPQKPTLGPNEDPNKPIQIITVKIHPDPDLPKATILSITKPTNGFAPDYLNQPKDGYTLQMLDRNNAVVYSLLFPPPSIHLDAPPGLNPQAVKPFDFPMTIPYNNKGQTIRLLDLDGKEMSRASIPK